MTGSERELVAYSLDETESVLGDLEKAQRGGDQAVLLECVGRAVERAKTHLKIVRKILLASKPRVRRRGGEAKGGQT